MYLSRGVLVLTAGLKALEQSLKLRNFMVLILPANPTDQEIADLLTHRMLITENSKDFLKPAVIQEFSIIDIDHATDDPERPADIISREWLSGSLRTRQPADARINADCSLTVREIEE